ncbi:TetR/AcrR family transcriptional regulator [Micrococcales bacterium 31B]|nr:TetR/AcrR family transcriptional regulator [Micrococcales bacterium 31B]
MTETLPTPPRPRRADAQRNREKILAAAMQEFGEQGDAACVEHIAQRAGVGVGSIYRSFGNKDALLREVYEAMVLNQIERTELVAAIADPRDSFEEYLRFTAEYLSRSRIMLSLHSLLKIDREWSHEKLRQRMAAAEVIFARAKSADLIHEHIGFTDIDLILRALAPFASRLETLREGAWQRYLDLVRALCYRTPPQPVSESDPLSTADYERLIMGPDAPALPAGGTAVAGVARRGSGGGADRARTASGLKTTQ